MESAPEDDSVGFDLQILHQAAATGTRPSRSIDENPRRQGLTSITNERDECHHRPTAFCGNIIT
jgi:hypothetical protein